MKNKLVLLLSLIEVFVGMTHEANAFYNPSTGRWLSRDPSQEEGGTNLYGCANNNPLNEFDPLGLMSAKCFAAHMAFQDAISDLATQFAMYNPAKDLAGGWVSPRSPKPTIPGGHAEKILNGMNRVERALRRVAQDCKDDYDPPCKKPHPDPVPVPPPLPSASPDFIKRMEQVTGLTGAALIAYLVLSEGSRLFLPRNAIPIP